MEIFIPVGCDRRRFECRVPGRWGGIYSEVSRTRERAPSRPRCWCEEISYPAGEPNEATAAERVSLRSERQDTETQLAVDRTGDPTPVRRKGYLAG